MKNMKNKLQIGQVVYGKPQSNAARYSSEICEFTVASLGNKYFTLKNKDGFSHRLKFSYETMQEVSEYSSNYLIYLDRKQLDDEIEKPLLLKSIMSKLEHLNVEQLNFLINELYLKKSSINKISSETTF